MKKILGIIFLLVLVAFVLKCCIRADIPNKQKNIIKTPIIQDTVYPQDNKNVILDGIDFIQSQAPVGKFGGELILSIIGVFNEILLFNCKQVW